MISAIALAGHQCHYFRGDLCLATDRCHSATYWSEGQQSPCCASCPDAAQRVSGCSTPPGDSALSVSPDGLQGLEPRLATGHRSTPSIRSGSLTAPRLLQLCRTRQDVATGRFVVIKSRYVATVPKAETGIRDQCQVSTCIDDRSSAVHGYLRSLWQCLSYFSRALNLFAVFFVHLIWVNVKTSA